MAADEAKAKRMLEKEVGSLTEAMYLVPENHILYYKRSSAYAALGNFPEALSDARKTVKLKPDWVVGYSILAAAQMGLHSYSDAVSSYRKALEIDPENRRLKSGLVRAVAAASSAGSEMAKMAPVEAKKARSSKDRKKFFGELKLNVRDKSQLLDLIREFPRGIAVNDLKDAYPTVMEDIQSLCVDEDVWLVRDSQPRGVVVIPNKRPDFKVGNTLRWLFHNIKGTPHDIPETDERDLQKNEMTPATNTAKRTAAIHDIASIPLTKKTKL